MRVGITPIRTLFLIFYTQLATCTSPVELSSGCAAQCSDAGIRVIQVDAGTRGCVWGGVEECEARSNIDRLARSGSLRVRRRRLGFVVAKSRQELVSP